MYIVYVALTISVGTALSVIAMFRPQIGANRVFQITGSVLFAFLETRIIVNVPRPSGGMDFAGAFFMMACIVIPLFFAAPFGTVIVASNLFRLVRGALGLDSMVVRPSYDQAQKAETNHDYDKAEQLYREALQHDRKEPEPHRRLALLYEKVGRYQEALEEFNAFAAATRDVEDKFMAIFQAADILEENLANPEAAIVLLKELVHKHPKVPAARSARQRLDRLKAVVKHSGRSTP